MANPDRTDANMDKWTGECEVANIAGTIGSDDTLTVDTTFTFSLTNHEQRCGFNYYYTVDFSKATAFWPNGTVKTWTPQGHLRIHENCSDTVPKNGERTHTDYIDEGGDDFDNIQSKTFNHDGKLWKVESYVKIDPVLADYGRTLDARKIEEFDAR